ncbi:MAG: VCBS repeat-containing protein [Deltaproteobacteria bacterium]|nr:VCBS repeat-containing protein [Deltaproteobacteria bacterium]
MPVRCSRTAVLCLALSACSLGGSEGEPYEPETCQIASRLQISPAYPVADLPSQSIEIDLEGVDLAGCDAQVFFGQERVEIVDRSFSVPNDLVCTNAHVSVQVPSAWRGEYPVSFRCGDFELNDQAVYLAEPRGWFLSAATDFQAFEDMLYCRAAVEDLDGDGAPEQVLSEPDGVTIRSFRTTGGALQVERRTLPGCEEMRPASLSVCDLNADGRPDLAWPWDGAIHVALQTAEGEFELLAPVPYRDGEPSDEIRCNDVLSGDLDGDGDVDLFGVMEGYAHLVLLNDGSGGLEAQTAVHPLSAQDGWSGLLLDVDSDGDLDAVITGVLFGISESWRNRLYQNEGGGRFVEVPDAVCDSAGPACSVHAIDLGGETVVAFGHIGASPSFLALRDGRFEPLGDLGIEREGVLSPASDRTNPELIMTERDNDLLVDRVVVYAWSSLLMAYVEHRQAIPLPVALPFFYPVHVVDLDGDGTRDLLSTNAVLPYRDLAERYPLD